jgi:hypothetical protein
MQLFAPVDFDYNCLPIQDECGWIFRYSRVSWHVSSERTPVVGGAMYVCKPVDAAWLATHVGNLINEERSAWSTGVGLRLDLSFMLWPIVNGRVPIQLEGWFALVSQPFEDLRGVFGGGFSIGY